MKGFRTAPQGSKKDQLKSLDTELKNLQMAGRINQMMTQQLLQTTQKMSADLGSALNQLFELQYKYTAIQKHLNLDTKALDEIANIQRLVDFDAGSAKADVTENLVTSDTVDADSTVILTSTATGTDGQDVGIFRSRIKLSECGVPALITELTGKKVGDKVKVTLAGAEHEVELLAVRNPALVAATPEATAQH